MIRTTLLAGLLVSAFAGEAFAQRWSSEGWVMLGENTVQGRRDFDTIEMGRGTGRYRKIMIVVHDADVVLQNFTVHFSNGEKQSNNGQMFFRGESRSHAMDLSGSARSIQRITYLAKDTRGRGKARVQVWGEKASMHRDGGDGPGHPPGHGGGGGGWNNRGWEKLGEQAVNGRNDVDTIHVGRREGRFRRIAIVVEGGEVELHDMVVTFHNGETFRPAIRHHFRQNATSREIDLPGDTRSIRNVTFRYGNAGRRGDQGRVELWGR
jgi:hypothetical protein